MTVNDREATLEVDAVVIGAGFSGIYMLHKRRGLGLRARLFETGDGVGGTWYWNRYPGARLRADMRLGARVTRALYDDETARWQVETDAGDRVVARYVVTAIGSISATNVPEIPGLECFTGRWYHTGRWPHDDVNLAGRRVGVIGTGSTGMQLIPVVADQAAELVVFQRTPNYSMPAP